MLKSIIVEDEKITRNGLIKHIPWNDLGIHKLETAESAEEALKICENFEPDIIISDIKMRSMNGITMCNELRKRYSDCQIIYISAYSDKKFLKAAIEQGVVNYVEKPIILSELIDAIKKAISMNQKVYEQKNMKSRFKEDITDIKSKVLHSLVISDDFGENTEKYVYNSGLFSADMTDCRICILYGSSKITNYSRFKTILDTKLEEICSKYEANYYFDISDATNIVLLLNCKEGELEKENPLLKEIQDFIMGINFQTIVFFLAIGDLIKAPRDMAVSYSSAKNALKSLSYKGFGSYAYSDEPYTDRHFELDRDILSDFSRALMEFDYEAVSHILNKIYNDIMKERPILNLSVRNIYYNLDNAIFNIEKTVMCLYQKEQYQSLEYSSKQIDNAKTLADLNAYIATHAKKMINNHQQELHNNSAVLQVLDIIIKEYNDPNLSVNTLADKVYLTPTYLAGLFKKGTGKTIGQHLTDFRIEKAKNLLKNKRYKLYYIANMVGYSDSNYFAKIFKRETGMTPSEYREKYLQ